MLPKKLKLGQCLTLESKKRKARCLLQHSLILLYTFLVSETRMACSFHR